MGPGLVQAGSYGLWVVILAGVEGGEVLHRDSECPGLPRASFGDAGLDDGYQDLGLLSHCKWLPAAESAHVFQLKSCCPLWRHPRPTPPQSPDGCN